MMNRDELIRVASRAIAEQQACGHCDGTCGSCQEEAVAVIDAILPLLPESRTIYEWGVLGGPGNQHDSVATSCTDPGGVYRDYDESLARYDGGSGPNSRLRRRKRTVYADAYGEWERVDD